jgi:hypothetical protein
VATPVSTVPSGGWRWQDSPKAALIFAICRRLIAGNIGPMEASRAIDSAVRSMRLRRADFDRTDFMFFYGVLAATSDFPMGPVRRQWSTAALEREDRKRQEADEGFRAQAVSEAQRLLTYEKKTDNAKH